MRRPPTPTAFLPGLVLLILLVGGCANSGTPATRSVLVNYQASGGIVSLEDQLTVYTDGHAELQRKNTELEFILEPSQVAHLKDLLDKAEFPSLKEEYLNISAGADLIEYSITYQVGGKKYTVDTEDGAVPDTLEPVLAELNQLISSHSQ